MKTSEMGEECKSGGCLCGAVKYEFDKPNLISAHHCHCKDCQVWSAGPINSASLWNPDLLEVTKGQEYIETYNKTEHSYRKFCKKCGGHLMNDHPGLKLIDVFAVILNGFSYKPTIHINYESKTVSVKDGLPKFRDMPEEFGGSGSTMPE